MLCDIGSSCAKQQPGCNYSSVQTVQNTSIPCTAGCVE